MFPPNISAIFQKNSDWNEIDLDELYKYFDKDNRDLLNEDWMLGFENISKRVIGQNPSNDIVQLLMCIVSSFHEISPRSFSAYQTMSHDCAIASLMLDKKKDFLEYVQQYIYNAIAQVTPNATNAKMDYYSFRGITNYSIDEITNEQISLAHPRSFNDPLDTLLNWWIDKEIKNMGSYSSYEQEFVLQMKKNAEHIKMRCLIGAKKKVGAITEDVYVQDLPVLMWSHYANSHKGMCVKYRFAPDFFRDYKAEGRALLFICPAHYKEGVRLEYKGEAFIGNALLIKSKDWEYENEKRMIYYSSPQVDNGKAIEEYPMIDCKGAIQAIYLGVKCSDADKRLVERAIGDKNIQLYKMVIDDDNPTRLKPIRIG